MNKDSGAPAIRNGAFLGLDVDPIDADIVILPVPWDVTTSYRAGAVKGPEAVIEGSYQIDLYSPYYAGVWDARIATLPISAEWKERSEDLRKKAEQYLEFLSQGGEVSESREQSHIVSEINEASEELNTWVHTRVKEHLERDQRVLVLGGDHSVPFGAIKAYSEIFPRLSILHFDAHADLREAYEDFDHSHASIMFNVLESTSITKLVQVGVRDISINEVEAIQASDRVRTFFDWDLQARLQNGENWKSLCKEIVSHLSDTVYVSFDIDGLDPKLCPGTGTPVPSGLEFSQAVTLLQTVIQSGRKIVGADLVEVAPHPLGDPWDGNVGARMLFQLCVGVLQSLPEGQ